MKKLHTGSIVGLLGIACVGCATQPPTSSSAQLPGSPEVRDALIACGAGMRSGATANIVAAYNRSTVNGSISAGVWRDIEAAFIQYVPASDVKEALTDYYDCVEKLAGKYVEPGALTPTNQAPSTATPAHKTGT